MLSKRPALSRQYVSTLWLMARMTENVRDRMAQQHEGTDWLPILEERSAKLVDQVFNDVAFPCTDLERQRAQRVIREIIYNNLAHVDAIEHVLGETVKELYRRAK